MQYAPIALFTYSRADHTRQAVESLLQNAEAKDSDLYIFSDGPKTEEKRAAVEENRKYIHSIKEINDNADDNEKSFRSVTIIEREKNWGLANSLIAGITEIVNKYGRVIVVEDDLIVSPYFLKFMNDGLEKYKDEDRVASISAFLNPVEGDIPETFFLRYFACWGWATWKRAWDLLNTDARDLLRQLRWKKNDFNIGGGGAFYEMLYCQKVGLVNSWAVRFYASCFLRNKLHLFPGRTMAIQTGMDGSGVHCGETSILNNMAVSKTAIQINDISIIESKNMYSAFSDYYSSGRKTSLNSLYRRFKSFVRRLLNIDAK